MNMDMDMDFTPPPNHLPPIEAHPISSIPSSSPSSSCKLPIKRKTPLSSSSSPPLLTPKFESDHGDGDGDGDDDFADVPNTRPPPFKYHRIWTEPDEIRFLQGLLDCSKQGLLFPKDLGLFYARFSNGMSQPYSKSQLSEKLRRLRKKFRVISSRLEKGLDKAMLSPQDRALYDLSKQLWDPDHSSNSPFGASNSNGKSNLVGIKVSFSPTLPCPSSAVLALPSVVQKQNISGDCNNSVDNDGPGNDGLNPSEVNVKLVDPGNDGMNPSEVNVKLDDHGKLGLKNGGGLSNGTVSFATKTVVDVLDQSLKEIRMLIDRHGNGNSNEEKEKNFEKRWRDQHVAEFEVLAKRLKLVVEQSLCGQ